MYSFILKPASLLRSQLIIQWSCEFLRCTPHPSLPPPRLYTTTKGRNATGWFPGLAKDHVLSVQVGRCLTWPLLGWLGRPWEMATQLPATVHKKNCEPLVLGLEKKQSEDLLTDSQFSVCLPVVSFWALLFISSIGYQKDSPRIGHCHKTQSAEAFA